MNTLSTDTFYTVIFIITVSTLFPMIGYYLDWRHKKKQHEQPQQQPAGGQEA